MENAGTEEATKKSESVIPEETLDYTVEAADMGRGRLEFKIQRSRPGTYMEAGLEQSDENNQTEEPETNVEEEAYEDVQEHIREEIRQILQQRGQKNRIMKNFRRRGFLQQGQNRTDSSHRTCCIFRPCEKSKIISTGD